ncbi:MAG: pyridoxal-phosphate dependent enzyme [Deinococcales bacterium]
MSTSHKASKTPQDGQLIDIPQILRAGATLSAILSPTPLQHCKRLSERYQANIYLKREDLQEVRSFKIRGAYHKIANLSEVEKANGVVCASAGNHAQGVAYSCNKLNIQGTIFMPKGTPNQKVRKVKNFGGTKVKVGTGGR